MYSRHFHKQRKVSHMHNLVHTFVNGTWFDIANSPNDPLFWFHHSFVDKLFEEWLAKRKKIPKLPPGARPGHGHNDSAVPLFPAEKLGDYFVPLRDLGARYDDENLSQLLKVTVRKMLEIRQYVISTIFFFQFAKFHVVGRWLATGKRCLKKQKFLELLATKLKRLQQN